MNDPVQDLYDEMLAKEALASAKLDGETQVDPESHARLEAKAESLLRTYGEDADWLSIAAMFSIGCDRLQKENAELRAAFS